MFPSLVHSRTGSTTRHASRSWQIQKRHVALRIALHFDAQTTSVVCNRNGPLRRQTQSRKHLKKYLRLPVTASSTACGWQLGCFCWRMLQGDCTEPDFDSWGKRPNKKSSPAAASAKCIDIVPVAIKKPGISESLSFSMFSKRFYKIL